MRDHWTPPTEDPSVVWQDKMARGLALGTNLAIVSAYLFAMVYLLTYPHPQ